MAYVDSSVDSLRTTPSSTSAGPSERLKVVIVGGSVAGLTLAHCLRHNNIDFVVLEAGSELAPQVGASIVVCSNGARILDQLGIYDDIEAMVEPLQKSCTWTGDGKLVIDSNAPVLSGVRTGYPFCFLTRRDLLKVISDHLPADRSNIYISKRVNKIEQTPNGVTAFCEDGTSFSGDVLVGTDGVRSGVRTQMFENIEAKSPGATEKDQKALSAEYNCIFGFGGPVKGHVVGGDTHRSYAKEHSTLALVGGDGRLFWFLFSKLDKRYFGKDIPRYTQADLDEAIKPFFDIHMTDEIKFKEVWEARTFANMVCVEEAQYEHWTDGRLVCVGDSIHKMTPNLGAGGNAAIESAAALANSLAQIKGGASATQIEQALKSYQTKRRSRANEICTVANGLTRIEALDSFAEKLMALHVIPALGDFLSDVTCDGIVGAEILDALPVPARAFTATMAWDPEAGLGKKEQKWKRALWALPLLAVLYGCNKTMGVSAAQLGHILKNIGSLPLPDGTSVAVPTTYFGVEALDKFISIYVGFFTSSIGNFDSAGRWQAIAFLGDLIPIQAVWMIEGIRRGNFTTAAHLLPTLFGLMYQIKGIGFIAPVYFFLHYVQSPLENYHAADNRLTQVGPAKTIIPTIILTYIAPTVAMFTLPTLSSRQWVNGLLWQPFPIYAAIMQRVLTHVVTDTTPEDRIKNPEADMPHLRKIYGFTFAAAAIANLFVRAASPISLTNVFFKSISSPSTILPAVAGIARTLRYDQLAAFGAASIWLGLHFKDLKKSGKLTTGWSRIVGVFTGTTLLAGPGAAMVAMWGWREEVLCRTSRPLAVQRAAAKAEKEDGLAY